MYGIKKNFFYSQDPPGGSSYGSYPEYGNYFRDEDYRIGFGRRFGAALIDTMLIFIIIIVVYNITGFFEVLGDYGEKIMEVSSSRSQSAETEIEMLTKQLLDNHLSMFIFTYFISLAYFSLEILIGASIGKLSLKIQIALPDRVYADYGKLFLRFVIKHSNVILYILGMALNIQFMGDIGFLAAIIILVGFFFTLGVKRQALHDMIAGTAVYHKQDLQNKNMTAAA